MHVPKALVSNWVPGCLLLSWSLISLLGLLMTLGRSWKRWKVALRPSAATSPSWRWTTMMGRLQVRSLTSCLYRFKQIVLCPWHSSPESAILWVSSFGMIWETSNLVLLGSINAHGSNNIYVVQSHVWWQFWLCWRMGSRIVEIQPREAPEHHFIWLNLSIYYILQCTPLHISSKIFMHLARPSSVIPLILHKVGSKWPTVGLIFGCLLI